MKSKIAKHPKYLIEVFHSTLEYGKDQRSYESRKGLIDWKDEIPVRLPYLEDGRLMMPMEAPDQLFYNAKMIVLDIDNHATMEAPSSTYHFGRYSSKHLAGNFSTYLNTNNEFILGYWQYKRWNEKTKLAREYFHVGVLRQGEPLEAKDNNVLDQKRQARKYIENCYLFQYIGPIKEFVFGAPIPEVYMKKVPQPVKTINLLKTLY